MTQGISLRSRTFRRVLLPFLTLVVSRAGTAQSRERGGGGATPPFPPTVIRRIDLYRGSVFDSVEARFLPYRLMNALHAVTRAWVIRRELLFQPGEPYDSDRVRESERNLRALGIFRDVVIDSLATDSGLVMRVHTTDAWTTTPGFDISSSGSQSVLSLSLQESNLFGTRTVALVSYENDPDRSSILAGFDVPRALANRIGIGATYLNRSDGRAGVVSIRQPFFSLSSRRGASLATQVSQGRVLRFVGGHSAPAEELHREFWVTRADAAIALRAGPRGYVRVGAIGQGRREDYVPEGSTLPIPRSVTVVFGPYVEVRVPRYIRVRNVASIDRTEDVDLGFRLRATVLAAPASWGYARDGVGGSLFLNTGYRLPSGFVQLGAGASALQSTAGIDSSSAGVEGTLVMQPADRLLFVGYASGGTLKNPHPGGEFDLGLNYGVRAFPSHAFTGDRQFLLNAESRLLLWPRLFGLVGVGVAAFVDHAAAWYHQMPRRSGSDAGIGLRIASIREAGSVWRIDIARRYANDVAPGGWVTSIGRGFVFRQ